MDGSLLFAFLIAILQGAIEQRVMRNGAHIAPNFLRYFNLEYHGLLFLCWSLICIGLGVWWFVPAFCVAEDWSWYRFHPYKTLGPHSWSNFGLGGFRVFGEWIPNSYILGFALSAVLFYISCGLS